VAKTVIGNLQVRLTAVTDGFTKSMFAASGSLKSFAKTMNTDVVKGGAQLAGFLTGKLFNAFTSIPRLVGSALSALTKFGLYLGTSLVAAATAAGGALLLLAKHSAAAIDELRKQSLVLKESVANLSVLKFAAGEADVEMEALTDSMFKLSRSIVDAARGTGTARDGLKALGLSAFDLIKLSPGEQFTKVAEALSKIENSSLRANTAVALFGKGAKAILPLLSENLADSAKWAEILNVKVSDFDAAQIDAAGDSVGRLQSAFAGVGNYIASKLAPIINGVSQSILNFIAAQGGVASIVERVMAGAAAIAVEALNRIGEAAQNAAAYAGGLGLSPDSPKNGINAASEGIGDLIQSVFYLGRLFSAIWETFRLAALSAIQGAIGTVKLLIEAANKLPLVNIDTTGITAAVDSIAKEMEDAATRSENAWSDVFGGADFYRTTTNAAQAVVGVGNKIANIADTGVKFVAQGFNDWTEALKNLGLDDVEAMIDRISVKIGETTSKVGGGITAADYFANGPMAKGDGPSDKIYKFTDKTVKQQETFADEMTRIWARTADSISDSLASALLDGENAFKSLANVAKSVAEQILSAFLNKTFISPLINAVTGGVGGGLFGATAGVTRDIASSTSGMSGEAAPTVQLVFKGDVYGMDDFNKRVKEGVLASHREVGDIAEARVSRNNSRKPRYALGT